MNIGDKIMILTDHNNLDVIAGDTGRIVGVTFGGNPRVRFDRDERMGYFMKWEVRKV